MNVCSVFIQAILGGNVAIIGTGAAPIEAKVLMFFKICFGCLVRFNIILGKLSIHIQMFGTFLKIVIATFEFFTKTKNRNNLKNSLHTKVVPKFIWNLFTFGETILELIVKVLEIFFMLIYVIISLIHIINTTLCLLLLGDWRIWPNREYFC